MRLVIDMQGVQGSNRQRGIGRYVLSLTQAIVRNRGEHTIILALNGLFADTIEQIREAFNGLLAQENIRVWQALPANHQDDDCTWQRRSAELIREAFLASLEPEIVLVSSLFEGLGDAAVTSIGSLSQTAPTAVILYDLIPLIRRHPYLESQETETWYEKKLDHLRRAALLLAISESSRQESIRYLSFPPHATVNISTAADSHFKPSVISSERDASVRDRYGLRRPFVMYTGGIDHRKNIEGLIRAYAKLPATLRSTHQLAIVCSIQPPSRAALTTLANAEGLQPDELVLTGYVPEEDLVDLYNLCKVFVFPSVHEGFGLPALEAMSCGRAVISSNSSSLPEVIGREDALFDPSSDQSISERLLRVLTDDDFRAELERHGLEQAKQFSWDATAQKAVAALEDCVAEYTNRQAGRVVTLRRPKLAFVSPLPPERSGIADYSAELIPELSRHYDIDVIVDQDAISTPWIKANCAVRSIAWFTANSDRYDRVLYHFGSSHFHQHMFRLLEDVPGIVVLHDFSLSGIVAHMDVTGCMPGIWSKALYSAHGYPAVHHRFHAEDTAEVVRSYPCNLTVLQQATGIIVHSECSLRLAAQWYGSEAARDWAVIPLLRIPEFRIDRAQARHLLGLHDDTFVVCSFGLLGPSKLNHRLVTAWLASALAKNANCLLIFVGQNHDGEYGKELLNLIRQNGMGERIHISGWTDTETFRRYLAVADVGVQLRTHSGGETSATVLDCMNFSIPTIVNAHGSMADLPDDGVWKLRDDFDDIDLVQALEILWADPASRQKLGAKGREIVLTKHDPRYCADLYADALETMYRRTVTDLPALTRALTELDPAPSQSSAWIYMAEAIALSIPGRLVPRQLFIDISELVQRDSKSGIQRVVRSLLRELLASPPEGFQVEPVYASSDRKYRYARQFTLRFLDCPDWTLTDDVIEFKAGDIFLGLDLQPHVVVAQRSFYQQMRAYGVQVQFVVYDLLPIMLPEAFVDGAAEQHHAWLQVVAENDGATCISGSVADELKEWIKRETLPRQRGFKVSWFHLGADIDASTPSKGIPGDTQKVLNELASRPSFLMVGTLEPRKCHSQVLAAFDMLWANGINVNLVIVGKQGWMVESLVERIRSHPELGKRLFWLDGVSDEYLEKIYAASVCLIAASTGEGFGLPLIEAAQHRVPIIARDIAPFREVANDSAFYFTGREPKNLTSAVESWLALDAQGAAPKSDGMRWLTWRQSTQQLLSAILPPPNA